MVSAKSVEDQLKKISYNRGWNKPETDELATILLPEEEIFEVVNGWYEGGYCILCATNIRVLLIDKKPFKFLTVEDLRFDTINQIDYSHRMFNASICITAGLKNLVFRSYNQPRLRKLIGHVQNRMAEMKRMEQAEHESHEDALQDIDKQLKEFLLSQYEQHRSLNVEPPAQPVTPATISDTSGDEEETDSQVALIPESLPEPSNTSAAVDPGAFATGASANELYEDGVKEIFGKYQVEPEASPVSGAPALDMSDPLQQSLSQNNPHVFDTNPLKIAYSKLPMILRAVNSGRRRETLQSDSI